MKPLDEIKARMNAATPGPWLVFDFDNDGTHYAVAEHASDIDNWENNARFMGEAIKDIPRLVRALELAMEQRNFNARCAIEDDVGVLKDEKARVLEIATEEDDLEIDRILSGMSIQDDVNAVRALLKMIPPDPEFVGVDGDAMLLRILDRLEQAEQDLAKARERSERYEKALRVADKLIRDMTNCIQAMKDGNEDENPWGRLRALRHEGFAFALIARAALSEEK